MKEYFALPSLWNSWAEYENDLQRNSLVIYEGVSYVTHIWVKVIKF